MFKLARNTALQLATQFSADYPVSLQGLTGRKSLDIYQKALISLGGKARFAQSENRFGILSRIVLARCFQSELARQGYSAATQRQATSELASAITFAPK